MTIKLKRVTNKKDLREFIRIPFSLYRKNPYWVPPLIKNEMDTLSPGKNPAFEYCETEYWIAYKNNQPAGRIAVILNRKFNQKWKRNDVAFTRFDFIDEDEVSSALIKQAEEWARKKKAGYIHGPLGFTNFDQQGMLIKGFDEISTLASVYNFSYYPEHMERMNFHKEIDYVEYQVNTPENVPERAVRISNIVLKKYDLRLFKAGSKKELLPYSEQIFDVINQQPGHWILYCDAVTVPCVPEGPGKAVSLWILAYFAGSQKSSQT